MPGDTKIKRTPQGWIDIDNPTIFHRARRLARDARRLNKMSQRPVFTSKVADRLITPDRAPFSGLQQRLYDRLTQRQCVSQNDAYAVVVSHGYNAAASYGHMREAGANHSEALAVIDLGSPDVSLSYGQARAAGYNHTYALQRALRQAVDDDGD